MKKKVVVYVIILLLMGTTLSLKASSYDDKHSVLATERPQEEDCGCESNQILPYQITLDETVGKSPKPSIAHDLPS